MKNLFKVSILVFFAFISATSLFADTTAITNSLSWLSSTQNSDGRFGMTETSILDTTNVLDTLSLLLPTSATHLNGITADLTNLITNENIDNGWGGDISSTSMVIDTALALDTLQSVNYSNQATISNAVLYLVTNRIQNRIFR